MMKITYIEKGHVCNYARTDIIKTIHAQDSFISGGLIYFKLDRYSYKTIAKEDIIKIEPEE